MAHVLADTFRSFRDKLLRKAVMAAAGYAAATGKLGVALIGAGGL